MSKPDEPHEPVDLAVLLRRESFIIGYCRALSDSIKVLRQISSAHHKTFMASTPDDIAIRIKAMAVCEEINNATVKLFDMMNTGHIYQRWDDHVAPKEESK